MKMNSFCYRCSLGLLKFKKFCSFFSFEEEDDTPTKHDDDEEDFVSWDNAAVFTHPIRIPMTVKRGEHQ